MTKPTTARRPSGSVKKLAESLGISRRHCRDLLDSGMPLDPQAASRWRAEKSGTGDAASSAERLREERIRLVQEQRQREELENARRRGETMPRSEHIEISIRCATAAKLAFWSLIGILPPMLAGLTEIPIAGILETHFRQVLDRLYQGNPELWDSPIGQAIIDELETRIRPSHELKN